MATNGRQTWPDCGAASPLTSSSQLKEFDSPQPGRECDRSAMACPVSAASAHQRPLLLSNLPTPREVSEAVEKALARENRWLRRWMRPRIEEAYKFQFLFGGKTVAYADGKQGREVIAINDEIAGALARLEPKERERVAIAFPSPWPTETVESMTPFFDEDPPAPQAGEKSVRLTPLLGRADFLDQFKICINGPVLTVKRRRWWDRLWGALFSRICSR